MKITAGDSDSAGAQFDHVTLRPDQHVGRYRIVSVLGQGGFGITYRAVDSELGRDVAIKEYLPAALAIRQDGTTVMPRSTGAAEDFAWGRDRFVAEGRTLAALHRTPGIVLVHDFLEANGTAYLVMELVNGRTLHEQVATAGSARRRSARHDLVAALRRAGRGPCGRVPPSRHQASEHPARCRGPRRR